MRAFSERNPIIIAVAGIATVLVVGAAVYYSDDLPIIGGGTTYSADFGDAAQLKTGDAVRIAGVKVGEVDSISLVQRHVHVAFKVKNAWIGDQSTAAIKIATTLGEEYVSIAPAGGTALDADTAIPLSRTSTPLDVQAALDGLSSNLGSIDTKQLATSFNTLADTFSDTPNSVRAALTGLSRLSVTIASRDAQLRSLATQANAVTGIVADNNANFTTLINSGAQLLQELQARSSAITQLLDGTRDFAANLAGIVNDNSKTLAPALAQLTKVTDILTANQGNLNAALAAIGPYYTLINNAAGNGPWVDIYVCGLLNGQTPILQANDPNRNCQPGGSS